VESKANACPDTIVLKSGHVDCSYKPCRPQESKEDKLDTHRVEAWGLKMERDKNTHTKYAVKTFNFAISVIGLDAENTARLATNHKS
jgi:hypothetical protein